MFEVQLLRCPPFVFHLPAQLTSAHPVMLPRLTLEAALRLRSSFLETPGGLARRPLPRPCHPYRLYHPNKPRHTSNNFNNDFIRLVKNLNLNVKLFCRCVVFIIRCFRFLQDSALKNIK